MITQDISLDKFLHSALKEDIGGRDVTSQILSKTHEAKGEAEFKSKGVLCGIEIAEKIFRLVDPDLRFLPAARDGEWMEETREAFFIEGHARSILSAERTALNLMGHLSGIATMTHEFVKRIEGTKTSIFDTRKTTPGLRTLEKYAVKTGGGKNHRMGLFDGVLLKDNHLKALGKKPHADLFKFYKDNVSQRIPVGIETRTLGEAEEAMRHGFDYVLLDHFTTDEVKRAVERRDQHGFQTALEVSGNIGLENVRSYALCGVDRISIGALTHSAKACDISLNFI
jgi:nicotinate-nucleotide pyrophosphorylase (carboxylating)